MEVNNKIVDKIKKLLSITEENNASRNEVEQAALLAQKLLQKYNIDSDVFNVDKELEIIRNKLDYEDYKGYLWAKQLALVVAKNYCCKIFLINNIITFYGYEEHTKVAKEVFRFLFNFGNEKALAYCREYAKEYGNSKGVYNSFCLGFVGGIKSVLDKQCVALQVVVPPKVEEAYKNISFSNVRQSKMNVNYDNNLNIYSDGFTKGKEVMERKKISGE